MDFSFTYNDNMDVRDGFKTYLGEKDKQFTIMNFWSIYRLEENFEVRTMRFSSKLDGNSR